MKIVGKLQFFEENFLQCLLRVRAPVSVCGEHRCVCMCVCVRRDDPRKQKVEIFDDFLRKIPLVFKFVEENVK